MRPGETSGLRSIGSSRFAWKLPWGILPHQVDALCQMTGETVSIDFRLFQGDEMSRYLEAAGFVGIKIVERAPYEFEYPTNRFYAFAKKPENSV